LPYPKAITLSTAILKISYSDSDTTDPALKYLMHFDIQTQYNEITAAGYVLTIAPQTTVTASKT